MDLEDFRYQDVLGQLPRLRTYTHFLLCFSLEESSRAEAIDSVKKAVSKLVDAVPLLSFRVVHDEASGAFRAEPFQQHEDAGPLVVVKDCTKICASYGEILKARGPVSLFDGTVLAPVKAFPQICDDSDPAAVVALQINYVQGGLLLDVAAHHNIIDGGGLLYYLQWLACVMAGGELAQEEISQANRDRRDLIKLLGPGERSLDHSHLLRESLKAIPTPSTTRAAAKWRFIHLPGDALAAIKARANADLADDDFVSTNDALSAFLWQKLTLARLRRGLSSHQKTKFSRALDARRALDIPRSYIGQMGFNSTCITTLQDVKQRSLGNLALTMRRKVQEDNTEYAVRSWATLIARESDKSRIMFGGSFNPETDVAVSSLVHGSIHNESFGLLGKPDLVRRPMFLPLNGVIYFWTETQSGGWDILACLTDEDMQGLQSDAEWQEATQYVG